MRTKDVHTTQLEKMTETESKRIARSIKAYPVNSNLPFSTYEKTAAHLQMQSPSTGTDPIGNKSTDSASR